MRLARCSRFLWPICVVGAMGLVILSLGSYVGPSHRWLDLTSSFRVQYLLAGLMLLGYFAWTRRKAWLMVSLMCVVLNGIEVMVWYIPPLPRPQLVAPSSGPETTRVMMFNVKHGNHRYSDVLELVRTENPTVAVFAEASRGWPQVLSGLQDRWPYRVMAPEMDLQIVSQVPIENPQIFAGDVLYAQQRGYLTVTIAAEHAAFAVMAVHTYSPSYFGDRGFELRNVQLNRGIGDFVRRSPLPVVVLGDLNTTMWSYHYRRAVQRARLHNARAGYGIEPTFFKSWLPGVALPIDHCLVTSTIDVLDFRVGPPVGSDHLPIITDLAIPSK